MSNFTAPAPNKPDSRIFASYPMPAKIDLINERPRRESLVEKQLENKIGQPVIPRIEITEKTTVETSFNTQGNWLPGRTQMNSQDNETLITASHSSHQASPNYQQQIQQVAQPQPMMHQQQQQQQQQQFMQNSSNLSTNSNNEMNKTVTSTTTTQTSILNRPNQNAALLAAELAQKEAKLMAEIEALHQRPYSPFQVPAKIDLTNEQKSIQMQSQNVPESRPFSRASSTRSTSATDFLDKEAKLLQEIEEMEKKPYNPQTMVVEREQWYEYPSGRPDYKHLTDSKRRVRDFCSMPSHMYPEQGRHVHEESPLTPAARSSTSAGSIHTTIIRSPKREVDNKSPLPFAFDNLTTKGVRGNIASVGAVEPDRPRAPIYPILKRSPSPNIAHV